MENIVWYPGHIAKARREIKEHLKDVDIVIEIIDARCPISSINFLSEEIKNKKRLIIVNKIDLADEEEVRKFDKKVVSKEINDFAETGDLILLKGSRGMGLERILPLIGMGGES